MPELPEVETIRRGLVKAITGKRIVQAEVRAEGLRTRFPKNLAGCLKDRRIISVTRRAKYLLINLDNAETLLIHLGMSGRLVLQKNEPAKKHDHIIIHLNDKSRLVLNDPRRFGLCDLVATDKLSNHKSLRTLGIEPLGKELTAPRLASLLKGKKTSIKNALMDQRLVAGLGNIYVCEALFYSGISPKRRAGNCSEQEIAKLVTAIRDVLRASIKSGGSSLRDYVRSDGKKGGFQNRFAVYGREGMPCKGCTCCIEKTGGVTRISQSGRSSFYCRTKQK